VIYADLAVYPGARAVLARARSAETDSAAVFCLDRGQS